MPIILTDSCADLSQDLISSYNLRVIPLHVLINNNDYLDGELSIQNLFDNVTKTGQLPKTAAPSILEFENFFDVNDELLYIGLSSKLSATLHNATLALEQLDNSSIHLVDSLNLSTGIGLLAIRAAELLDQGVSVIDVAQKIIALRSKVRTAFVIDTMEYLHKGGRCTGMQAIVGTMLKIRPIIHVQSDGTLAVLDKVRGSRKKALNVLLDKFKADLPTIDLTRVFVTHSGCVDDAEYLVRELNQIADIKNIHTTVAGATIASHCGPNTIGILYLTV